MRETDLRSFFVAHAIPLPADFDTPTVTRRLMVVDPDGRAGSALARALRKADAALDVTTVSDAIDALVRIGVSPPHVLVVDGGTTVDPLTIARALKGQATTSKVALIVIVGTKIEADAEKKLRSAGAKAIFTRPVTAEQILAAI